MTDTAIWETQQAVFAALDGDATLGALIGGVYDYVPETASYPYVRIADVVSIARDNLATVMREIRMNLLVAGEADGKNQVIEIADRLCALLDKQYLSISGYTVLHMRVDRVEVDQQSNGRYSSLVVLNVMVSE